MQGKEFTKLVTRLEGGEALPSELYARTGKARIVGITGPPGVGKSSLIDRLIDELRKQGKKVGLLNIKLYRPFPYKEVGHEIASYIYGLGGRDTLRKDIEKVFKDMKEGEISNKIKYIK